MNESPTYRLSCDIRSSVKAGVLYGKQSEEVKLVADHDKVLIVQGECGRLFSVERIDLTTEEVELTEQLAFIPQKAPTKKSSKKPTPIKSTLF